MSQEKAQLIAPLGNMTVPGVTATGVITATSFEGNIAGSATSIKQGSSVSAGVVTASSFAGNLTGNIQRLADSGPNISVGVVTATSFSGNLTGSVTDLTSAPAITVGVVTATTLKGPVTGNITGNVSGTAGGLGVSYNGGWPGAGTSQISAGVMTATYYHGDGSNLDGVSSGPVSQQAVTANGATTTIDLSNGNLIYMTQSVDTTVSFANTENGNVYIIRTKDDTSTARSITWPTGIGWSGGSAPTLLTNPRDPDAQVFLLTTRNEGVTWYGKEIVRYDPQTFGLYGAGATGYGGLGNNESSGGYYSSPVQIPGTSWSSLADTAWTGGVGGAIKTDGSLWVWGKTNVGILGLNVAGAGLGDSLSSPIQLGTETTWDNVCFGGNNSEGCMAVKTDGSLWAWGANNYGILGLNEQGGAPTYPTSRSSPTQVGTDKTWKYVNYGGEDVILSIKTDGTLWSWGGNNAGQAGQNTPGSTPALRSSPVQVGTDTSWAYASNCRNGTSIATKTDGTLWCWGDNSKGQCGQNTIAPSSYNGLSSPTQVGTDTDWNYDNGSKIVAGYQRVFAIKTNGTLWGWGRTHQGQLGLNEGGYKDYSSPTQIPGTNWATIKSIGEVIATKTDGTLWSWGDQGQGVGMLNSLVDRSSPTQVPGSWNSGERGIRAGSPHFALKVE